MSYRTSKCTHGDRGMCINCLVNKNKMEKKGLISEEKVAKLECQHPPHMKCLRCLAPLQKQKLCSHPDYQKCKKCEHYISYDTFRYYLDALQNDCKHKKPCQKCVPPLSRKTYYIDKTCRNHLPYPQAQCDACMAPTLTVANQRYTHVTKVVIRTTSIYKIIDANLFGILLGYEKDGVVYVEDVYFPEDQQIKSHYLSPDSVGKYSHIFDYFNLKEVGLLYSSSQITGLSLMISSLFQERFAAFEDGHQISKFITMRLQMSSNEEEESHFECFMVSDQLQSFHRNNIIYEKETHDNYFDLITARNQKMSQLPTFLREGVETDVLFFKEVIVWIPTVSQQNFFEVNPLSYPFFTAQPQDFQDLKKYCELEFNSLQKYRNIQFLLHLSKLIGPHNVQIFLHNFFIDSPQIFIAEKIKILEQIEIGKLRELTDSRIYQRKYRQR